MSDLLDRNLGKLVRSAPHPEACRPGAQEKIFQAVLNRLAKERRARRRLALWSGLAAAAAAGVFLVFAMEWIYPVKPAPAPKRVVRVAPPRDRSTPTSRPGQDPAATGRTRSLDSLFLRPNPGQTLQETMKDGSRIEVSEGSEVEIIQSQPPAPLRPFVTLHEGRCSLRVAKSADPFRVRTPAGELSVYEGSVEMTLKTLPPMPAAPASEAKAEALNPAASRATASLVVEVKVLDGEVIARDRTGTEQLVCAGEMVSLGEPAPAEMQLVENWRSGQLVPRLEDGRPGEPLEVRRHTVEARIKEQLAFVEVDQVFYNPSDQRLEGTFYFPLPHEATICRLAMYVGDNLMEGEIAEAQRARRTFEALLVQRQDPALLEWAGGNLFKMRVFPIEPKSEKRVLIGYCQVLEKERRRATFTYPLASDSLQKHPVGEIDVRVTLDSTPEILSAATPELEGAIEKSPHQVKAKYEAKGARPAKDFKLEWETAKGQGELVVAPYWHSRRSEGYFLMIFSPEMEEFASEKRRGGRFVFVLDTSTGLGARHLALAVKTVKQALSHLLPKDRFGIVAYDAAARKFLSDLVPATAENVLTAGNWLERLEAFGASDLSRAWSAAAELVPAQEAGATDLVYVGSGLSSLTSTQAGKLLADAQGALAGHEIRVHCLPVGAVQDLNFLSELAKTYSGTLRPVSDAEDAATAAEELLHEFNLPLYRNLELSFGELPLEGLYPLKLPNVTAGRQVLVFGKYRAHCEGTLKLCARQGDEAYARELKVRLGADHAHPMVPRLWASRRIEQLQIEAGLAGAEEAQELVRSVIETSKRFRVMSQFTSFIVLETAEDYLRYGIERRPDEFSDQDNDFEVTALTGSTTAWLGEPLMDAKSGAPAPQASMDLLLEMLEKNPQKGIRRGNKLRSFAQTAELPPGSGSFGSRRGGGRKLMVMRHGGSRASKLESIWKPQSATLAIRAVDGSDFIDGSTLAENIESIDTLSWSRQDLFPVFERPSPGAWNPTWQHGEAKALEILKGLANRFKSLAAALTSFGLDEDGRETQQGRAWVLILDVAKGAFLSRRLGEDHLDVCDGKVRTQLFPQLKYAARRGAGESDLISVADGVLPGFLFPWAERIDREWLAKVERDGPEGIVLRLTRRAEPLEYTLIHLAAAQGPVLRVEYFESRWEGGRKHSVKTRTVLCEEIQELAGLKVPAVYRHIQHSAGKDQAVGLTRLAKLRVNFEPEGKTFQAEIPSDWAVRNLDAVPGDTERRAISAPLNPAGN